MSTNAPASLNGVLAPLAPTPDETGELREAIRARNWTGLLVAGLIVWLLEPVYWALDRELVPQALHGNALVLRTVLFVVGALVTLCAARTPAALRRYDLHLSFALAVLVTSTMNVFVAWTGAGDSDYFVGTMFSMIVIGFVFTWPAELVAAFYGVALVPYAWLVLGAPAPGPTVFAWAHLVYLLTTAAVTGTTQYVRQRLERREFLAKARLARTSADLGRALDQLQELDRLKNEFFGTITHELRSPLTMILSPVDALLQRSDELSERQATSLALVRRNGLKLLKMINDILDIAKMDDGKLRLTPRDVDLRAQVDGIVAQTATLAARKQISVELDAPDDDYTAFLDAEQMERALLNVVANSLKFTDQGGRVRVSLRTTPTQVTVDVADSGIGIPPDRIAVVFDRFVQADPSATRRYGGSGLGLSFARQVTTLHGGTLTVASTVGVGSTFTFMLPKGRGHIAPEALERRRRDEGTEIERRAEDADIREWTQALTVEPEYRYFDVADATERRAVERGRDEGKSTRVLLVEDNPEMLAFIHTLLVDQHQVYTALDGRRGLELARRERPDVIVTDFNMPEMSGAELCAAIRADADLAETPIVMLTARNTSDARVAGRQAGADVYLTKPFDPGEFEAVITRLLQQRGRALSGLVAAHAKSLELMSAGLAHEIHNPLSRIKSAHYVISECADRLAQAGRAGDDGGAQSDKPAARLANMVKVADRAIDRIGEIVSLIHLYARDGYPTTPSDVLIDALAARTIDTAIAVPEGATLSVDLQCPGATVAGVADELTQVVRTLVQNALDAVASIPGGRVRVRSLREKRSYVLVVDDNGVGIPRDVLPRVFTPFFSTKASTDGMGLGLAIAHQVVTAARGAIRVTSEPGAGTRFEVRLPLSRVDDDEGAGGD